MAMVRDKLCNTGFVVGMNESHSMAHMKRLPWPDVCLVHRQKWRESAKNLFFGE